MALQTESPALQVVTLTGEHVRLLPLTETMIPELYEMGQDPAVWEHFWLRLDAPQVMQQYVERGLSGLAAGTVLPFAVQQKSTGRLVGATTLMDYSRYHRSIEIGSTWLNPSVWRTAVNSECKLLLMTHAFEQLNVVRVQLKTDARNERSRAAILRLGAQFEGILRKHMRRPDGTWRDSAYYAVTDEEWPGVKERLEGFLRN